MRSDFEKTLKQHRDSLAEELLQLGKYREAQLVEWDIEQNESNYEYYFNAGWSAQQSKIDELQKRVDAAQKLIDDWNCGGVNLFDLIDELEQALKGGEE